VAPGTGWRRTGAELVTRQPRRGIRVRVTAIAVLTTAAVLAAGAVAVVIVERGVLQDALDRSLVERADAVAAQLQAADTTIGIEDDEDRVVQVVSSAGAIVAASPRLRGQPPIGPALAPRAERFGTLSGAAVGGDHFRLLTRGVETDRGALTVHVAEDTGDTTDAVRALAASLALATAVAVVVLGALVWWLVGRTLRPVERIRAEVAAIGAGGLDRRVSAPPTGDEIARLAETMNEMLDRLQQAAVRQERFVSDASHELRTPLSRLRALVEVQLATPDRSADRAVLGDVLAEAEALQVLLADLLDLARQDGLAGTPRRQPVDLDDVALAEVQRARQSGVDVDASGVGAAQVVGDPRQLARAVQNLLDNAARHARATVSVSVRESVDEATLEVADDGDGVPPGTEELIFEPFTRLDEARDPNAGLAGLGLAIVRDIVTAHHGTVHVEHRRGSGAVFVVRLPRAP
jgi:signal transduction histidine kinase